MIRCNGAPVLALSLALPRIGAWVAELELDSDDGIEGEATIDDGAGTVYRGTVRPGESGVQVGRTVARVVGGAGGLSRQLSCRHYRGAAASLVVGDILAEAGETLDSHSDPLATVLDAWSRPGAPDPASTAGAALSTLCTTLGLNWRVLPGGTVWIGVEDDNAVTLTDALELRRDPSQKLIMLAMDSLALHAGDLLGTERVGRVEYTVRQGEGIRAQYWIAA